MAIREVDVILYCGQPSTTSGDVCQDIAQSEDDCTLLSSTEGGEYVCYKVRKSFFLASCILFKQNLSTWDAMMTIHSNLITHLFS